MRKILNLECASSPKLQFIGLDPRMILDSVNHTHAILDTMDANLITSGSVRLAQLVELANLSSIVGNIFRAGIIKHCNGIFVPNAPHTFPDLLAASPTCQSTEIKVALETNKPKGHLVKPGPHIIVRYVLGSIDGNFLHGKETRGDVVWIWEVRAGVLLDQHFNVSNTEGDSGKTAVINAEGMNSLDIIYLDESKIPKSARAKKSKL